MTLALLSDWRYGILVGWMSATLLFLTWMWSTLAPMDAARTADHAVRDNPNHATTDLAVLAACLASVVAVGFLLAGSAGGPDQELVAGLSVSSVLLAWATVHTIFATRYARLYYTGHDGGVDFNEIEPPQYTDFAYLAFTIGMTFQVSDTDLQTKEIRSTALRHALLSYVLGAIVLATTINLVAGLAR
ncbi:MAG TPA: DUF1345 domain-containing protein [Microlunatus sp.]|nr:DUF1345 domain-containing protein [Microlunatus sp.]